MPSDGSATGNLFLQMMPSAGQDAILPRLKCVSLEQHRELYLVGDPIEEVMFPIHSVVSTVSDMADGDIVEIGIVGREGMTGSAIILGQSISTHRSNVQVPDSAHCMLARDFCGALEKEPDLKAYALRYIEATFLTLSQSIACNGLHPVNERCARWLLMAHDRVEGDSMLLTQEFLSQMLGIRRASVTVAASSLQEAGFISYHRGEITINDRTGLESAACECYGTVEKAWKNVMGYSVSKTAAVFTQQRPFDDPATADGSSSRKPRR